MESQKPVVTLCLGANKPPRHQNLQRALTLISEIFVGEPETSSVYETPSHSGFGAPYLNQVVRGRLRIPLPELEAYAKHIERMLGRTPASKEKGDVPADIDLVIADDRIIRDFDFNARHFTIGYEQLTKN